MKMKRLDVRNLVSVRGALALALLATYTPYSAWWKQGILLVTVTYLIVTALFGRRN